MVQNELNICCLRTGVKLMERLQLQPLDGSTGDDSVHVVSRLFVRYSNTLMRGLELCQYDIPVRRILSSFGVHEVQSMQTSDSVSDVPTLQQVRIDL